MHTHGSCIINVEIQSLPSQGMNKKVIFTLISLFWKMSWPLINTFISPADVAIHSWTQILWVLFPLKVFWPFNMNRTHPVYSTGSAEGERKSLL